jgi:hypothetical protein
MRWIVLAEQPHEYMDCDPSYNWAMRPSFHREEGGAEENDGRVFWMVALYHCHWDVNNPGDSPDMVRCGLINREETMKNLEAAEYECDKCSKSAPKAVIEEKFKRQSSLKGTDPRNDRRGAVLATRESNLIEEGIVNG